jgi:hypothetical protein
VAALAALLVLGAPGTYLAADALVNRPAATTASNEDAVRVDPVEQVLAPDVELTAAQRELLAAGPLDLLTNCRPPT